MCRCLCLLLRIMMHRLLVFFGRYFFVFHHDDNSSWRIGYFHGSWYVWKVYVCMHVLSMIEDTTLDWDVVIKAILFLGLDDFQDIIPVREDLFGGIFCWCICNCVCSRIRNIINTQRCVWFVVCWRRFRCSMFAQKLSYCLCLSVDYGRFVVPVLLLLLLLIGHSSSEHR